MSDRSRYRLALTLTVVLAALTVSTLWFVTTFAGVLALLIVGVPLLPCLVFCVWRTWTSRGRLHSDLTGAAQEAEVSAHRWEGAPPREQWAGSRELDHQRSALRVIGHRPGAWFLLERGDGSLLLDARYSNGALIDGSVVLLLSDEERSAYRNEGDVFVNRLQELVHHQAPYLRTSPWHARNLSRLYGVAVDAAIADFLGDQSGVERAP